MPKSTNEQRIFAISMNAADRYDPVDHDFDDGLFSTNFDEELMTEVLGYNPHSRLEGQP